MLVPQDEQTESPDLPDVRAQVIGKVGFGKSFNALESLDHPAEGDAFKVVAIGDSCPQLSC